MAVDRSEIAFFDLETTRPPREGQKFTVLEFGAILVCPWKLIELDSFCTLIRPADLSLISETSFKYKGITHSDLAAAPKFEEIADRIYYYLDGRVWAGHNIVNFDCVRIREAFAEIGRSPPEAKELIDSFLLLQPTFGRRAGDMKMATIANYFGLGSQKHRSLDDVRMNLEVLKSCATVLFLELHVPNVLPAAISVPGVLENETLVSAQRCKVKQSKCTESEDFLEPREISKFSPEVLEDKNLGILSGTSNVVLVSPNKHCEAKQLECTESEEFLEPHEISTSSLRTTFEPSQWGTQKMTLLHKGIPFRMHTSNMMIRYGISRKFFVPTGKPRLSFVVEPPVEISNILKECDVLAQNLFSGYNDKSEWTPLLTMKYGPIPAIRMHLATTGFGEKATYSTEFYRRDSTGTTQRLPFKAVDINELDELFVNGRLVDADYDFDIYDYQQQAGIRLLARRLTVSVK